MIKGSIQEEDITIINIHALIIGAPQYVRQMLTSMKGEINSNTIIVGDFNIPLTPMDRSTKQKISKETQTLNDTMDQLDLIAIYRTFHPKTINFTFFSNAHGTFFRIDHILGHKSSLGKLKKKKKEIIPSIFSDHNSVRLDVNYRKSRAKAIRVLPREFTGHSKHPFPTTQEKTLHMDIIRWPTPRSDLLYSLQSKVEKLYSQQKQDQELTVAQIMNSLLPNSDLN